MDVPELSASGNTVEEIEEYLMHMLFRALDRNKAHIQVCVGIEARTEGYKPRTKARRTYAVNDTRHIAGCYPWELRINRLRCHTCHDNSSESQYTRDFRL